MNFASLPNKPADPLSGTIANGKILASVVSIKPMLYITHLKQSFSIQF
jgi:hypothetical protein